MLPVTLGRPKVAVKVWFLPQAGNSAAFGKADTCNTKTQEPLQTLSITSRIASGCDASQGEVLGCSLARCTCGLRATHRPN